MNRAYISDKNLNAKKEVKIASEINKCGHCKGTVYHAPLVAYQQIKGLGKLWHANCFVCANATCKKSLDRINVAKHEGEAYCETCYANKAWLRCKYCEKCLDPSTMEAYENETYCTFCYSKYDTPLAKR